MEETSKTLDGYQNVKRTESSKRKSSKKDPNVNKQVTTYSWKSMFVGMDVHKKFLQIVMICKKTKVVFNEKTKNEQSH